VGNANRAPAPPSRAIMAAPNTFMSMNSNVMKVLTAEVAEYIYHYLLQDTLMVLPRPVGGAVAPHRYHFNLEKNVAPGTRGAFLATNDPDGIIWEGEISPDITYNGLGLDISMSQSTTAPPGVLSMDTTINVGTNKVKTSTATSGTLAVHYSNTDKKFVPGLKYYPGGWNFTSDAVAFEIKNTSTAAITPTYYYGIVQPTGNAVLYGSFSGSAIAADATGSTAVPVNASWATFKTAAADSTQSKGIWFGFSFTGANYLYSGARYSVLIDEVEHLGPTIWYKHSLWDNIEKGVNSKQQFDSAARHCMTGLRCTFSNTTPELSKGGNIYGAKLPGNSYQDLPGDYETLRKLLTSQPVNAMDSHLLAEGASYSFCPEKQQDWEFVPRYEEDPVLGNANNLPYFACCYDATSIASVSTFVFDVACSMEYLTTDPSNLFFQSHANANFYFALLNELSMHSCVGHNPDHFDKMKAIAKKICTSDNIKMVLSGMISAGVKIAPLALSLLL
jgi:hypothetical protein